MLIEIFKTHDRFLVCLFHFSLMMRNFSTDFFLLIWFHTNSRKIPWQSRCRQNIYLSELTNEYWRTSSMNKKKIHWNFLFPLLRRRCRVDVLRLYWFALVECLLFIWQSFSNMLFCFGREVKNINVAVARWWRRWSVNAVLFQCKRKVRSLDLNWKKFKARNEA